MSSRPVGGTMTLKVNDAVIVTAIAKLVGCGTVELVVEGGGRTARRGELQRREDGRYPRGSCGRRATSEHRASGHAARRRACCPSIGPPVCARGALHLASRGS